MGTRHRVATIWHCFKAIALNIVSKSILTPRVKHFSYFSLTQKSLCVVRCRILLKILQAQLWFQSGILLLTQDMMTKKSQSLGRFKKAKLPPWETERSQMYVFKNLPDVLMYYSDILSNLCWGKFFIKFFLSDRIFKTDKHIFYNCSCSVSVFFYLVEVSPAYDLSGNTSLTAANLLFEMICVLRL